MMRGELLCWDGRRIRLPDAVEWRFQYGCGTPCDSFQITCLWEPDSGNDLAEAVSFTAEENGERLFTGVVDECERGWDTAGGTLTVAGRGMAARLLDNEALGADYQVATVEDILRDHVAPYGIEIVRGAELLQLLRGEGALGLRPAVRAPRQQADAGGPVEGVVRPGRDPLKVVTGGHSAGQKGVPPQVDGVAAEQDGGLLAGDGAVRDKKCAAGAPHDPKIIGPGYSRGTGGVGIHIGERAVGIVGDSTRAGP